MAGGDGGDAAPELRNSDPPLGIPQQTAGWTCTLTLSFAGTFSWVCPKHEEGPQAFPSLGLSGASGEGSVRLASDTLNSLEPQDTYQCDIYSRSRCCLRCWAIRKTTSWAQLTFQQRKVRDGVLSCQEVTCATGQLRRSKWRTELLERGLGRPA